MSNTLSERIKTARTDAGLSQAQLARILGITRSAVSQWEDGSSRSLDSKNLLLVSKALGVSPEWILSGEEAANPNLMGRNLFAAMAMQGMLSSTYEKGYVANEKVVKDAVYVADMLIAELSQNEPRERDEEMQCLESWP